mgnify:FL=1
MAETEVELAAPPRARPARRGPVPLPPGRGQRLARNLRAGDVLARPGRPQVAEVDERNGKIRVRTERGALLYFTAGAAVGVLLST